MGNRLIRSAAYSVMCIRLHVLSVSPHIHACKCVCVVSLLHAKRSQRNRVASLLHPPLGNRLPRRLPSFTHLQHADAVNVDKAYSQSWSLRSMAFGGSPSRFNLIWNSRFHLSNGMYLVLESASISRSVHKC